MCAPSLAMSAAYCCSWPKAAFKAISPGDRHLPERLADRPRPAKLRDITAETGQRHPILIGIAEGVFTRTLPLM